VAIAPGASAKEAVPQKVRPPINGVTLTEGPLARSQEANISYLLAIGDVDNMLHRYRLAAGQKNPPGRIAGWERMFCAHAAHFLMGTGNTLRWTEHPELRRRMNRVIQGLKECCSAKGELVIPYGRAHGFKQDFLGDSLTILTLGLDAAGRAGNPDAATVQAAAGRWYRSLVARETARNPDFCVRKSQNYFGVTACMNNYFSSVGVKEDVETARRHVDQRYAFTYGPILLACRGPLGKPVPVLITHDPGTLLEKLKPVEGHPLEFVVPGLDTHHLVPYFRLNDDQTFTCYPAVKAP
jgi:hypothetical protein